MLCYINNPKMYLRKQTRKLSENLENWMSNLPEKVKLIPLIYLAIPGSHDSFTSNITIKSDMAPDAEDILKALKFLGPLVKFFIVNWSRTQTYTAKEQLTKGIRYFDLRLATKKNTEDLFFVHGLYSDSVQSVFNEISTFLDNHPQEVVILDCQHFYSFKDSDHEKLIQIFAKSFGSKLLPYLKNLSLITLDFLTIQNTYQVIVIYRFDERVGHPLLWPGQCFPNPWLDTVSTTELFPLLDQGIKNRASNEAFISQCILTPSFAFIVRNLFGTLKEKCAKILEKAKLEWISKQKSGVRGMNIVISDYIELSDCIYVKKVIDLNNQLM